MNFKTNVSCSCSSEVLLVYSCMHFVDCIDIVFKVRPFAFFKGRFDMQEKITIRSRTVQMLMGRFIVVHFYHFF